jgi:ATP-dependent Clp protease ATP-binding subunit ClpX
VAHLQGSTKSLKREAAHQVLVSAQKLQTAEDKNRCDIFADVMPEDLLKFGMIPEFIGRLPVMTSVEQLDKPALMQILTEPKNALVKQYQKLFDLDDVELEFAPDALDAIADLALKRGTGARGLRAIMEASLLGVMYEVPSRSDIAKVIIEKDCIENGAAPTLINRTGDIPKRASRRDKSTEEKARKSNLELPLCPRKSVN